MKSSKKQKIYYIKIVISEIWSRFKKHIFTPNLSTTLLSIMSIIVSIVAVNIGINANKIANKELDILENDREAYFVIEDGRSKPYETAYDFGNTHEYLICNAGGRITNSNIQTMAYLYIEIYPNSDTTTEPVIYSAPMPKYCYIKDGYNKKNKTFTFYSRASYMLPGFEARLTEQLEEILHGCTIIITRKDLVNIRYTNFQNIDKIIEFDVSNGVLENNHYQARDIGMAILNLSDEISNNITNKIIKLYKETQ